MLGVAHTDVALQIQIGAYVRQQGSPLACNELVTPARQPGLHLVQFYLALTYTWNCPFHRLEPDDSARYVPYLYLSRNPKDPKTLLSFLGINLLV